MASAHRFVAAVAGAIAVQVVFAGCGDLIGLSPVPNPGAGADAASGGDGGIQGRDGASGGDGGTTLPDTGRPPTSDAGASVLMHHMNPSRDGHYVDPLMTAAYAATLTVDSTFNGAFTGPLWGQPLYVENGVGGKGTYYVADDNNDIYAIDETTGQPLSISKTPLAMSAGQAGSGCGNVTPVGVTGTPYIDSTSRTMYFVAAVGTGSGIMTHEIHALSIDTLDEVTGWPIDVSQITSSSGANVAFNPPPEGQRGGLALLNGYLYAAWGGEDGDCGDYHGWVVAVPVANPGGATGYATAAQGGGMWAVTGLASDGVDMFGVTGNATGGSGSTWASKQGEAVLRFHDGTAFDATNTANFFAPSNWQDLDNGDTDLVGAGPLVIDVAGANPSSLVVAMGKSGVMHLLNRANLGGVGTGNGTTGEGVYSDQLAGGDLRGAAASYTTSTGTYVVVRADGNGSNCPNGGGDLIAVQITATSPPTFKTVWCADSGGSGSPIVTTTDTAGSNPIVWVVGAEGSNQLTGWNGETGASIFNGGGTTMNSVIHWTTPIDVKGRILVGANNKLYAFKGM